MARLIIQTVFLILLLVPIYARCYNKVDTPNVLSEVYTCAVR